MTAGGGDRFIMARVSQAAMESELHLNSGQWPIL